MAAEPALQRTYRAACPGCGAPVEFRSAQSTHAVCAYCQSTVARSGETLSRVGKMAELFDDHSPLQLQASGVWKGKRFTLVGRLQYRYAEGSWTEWYAVLEDGSSAFLSEDNGAYVFATAVQVGRELPGAERFRVGTTTAIKGKSFSVASNNQVALLSAQGELPRLPLQGQWFAMVELRSQDGGGGTRATGEVLSIDYGCQPTTVSSGQSVLLDELKLTGLRNESVKNENARQFSCPNCGAQLTPLLASSKTLSCTSCHSIIDLSQGIGAELQHALQDEPVMPLIPLGSQGAMQGVLWQVVGFQHRMGSEPNDPDEQFGWEEYLLYNAKRGFIFLVDSTEGWSVVQPCTGAPEMGADQQSATYRGSNYRLKESYNAETTYVAGEFYWQVRRGQKTWNRDFVSGRNLLSMEQSAQEVTWSSGSQIDSDLVARTFKLEGKKDLLKRSDVGPFSAAKSISVGAMVLLVLLLLLVLILLGRCSSCDPTTQNCASGSGMRTSGGSYGGYSSGGGHK
jgi:ribosomal protein L37AE/L43A